jgi:hypothetical protein
VRAASPSAGAPPTSSRPAPRSAVVTDVVAREALPALVVALFAAILALRAAWSFNQDGWLALVSGREIVRHGLPSSDHLAFWTEGARWIDQQWLGQLGIYALDAVGGLRLVLAAHLLVATAAFGCAVVVARRLGGSPRSTALVALAAFLPVVVESSEVRTQALAGLFFVLYVGLLSTEARAPSRRLYLVFPLLVVWANVHGSVVLGVGLTVLAGLALAWEQSRLPSADRLRAWPRRVVALLLGPILCAIASPYGLSLAGYYHRTLLNGDFGRFVTEWRPTTLSLSTAPVFLIAGGGLWLIGRAGKRIPLFERLMFVAIAVAAFAAVRNIGWLGLAAIVVLPRLIDAVVREVTPFRRSPLDVAVAGVALAAVFTALFTAAAGSGPQLHDGYPMGARAAVARELRADPGARVFADLRFADWLLWSVPEARGRVAVDVRFELLSQAQLKRLQRWVGEQTDSWRSAAAGSSLIVVDRPADPRKVRALVRTGAHVLYADREVAVLSAGPQP